MVVFTCSYCGDSINKPKVDKHYQTRCRGKVPNLSCMDCFKDFYDGDHESHTKCISEEQRYGGAGFVASVKKGESKQEAWVQLVQQALDNTDVSKQVTRILQEVSKHSNTPRKKAKFINFVKNVCGHRTMPVDIDAAWDVLAKQLDTLRHNSMQTKKNTDDTLLNGHKTNGHAENVQDINGEKKVKVIHSEQGEKKEKHKGKQDNGEPSTGSEHKENDEMTAVENYLEGKKKIDKNIETDTSNDKLIRKYTHKQNKKRKLGDIEEISNIENSSQVKKKIKKFVNGSHFVDKVTESNAENCTSPSEKQKETSIREVEQLNLVEYGSQNKQKKNKNKHVEREINKECDTSNSKLNNSKENNIEAARKSLVGNESKPSKFQWQERIEAAVRGRGGSAKLRKVKKIVLREYSQETGRDVDERTSKKLLHKLNTSNTVRVQDNIVSLLI